MINDPVGAAACDTVSAQPTAETGLELPVGAGNDLLAAAKEANRRAQMSAALGRVQELLVNLEKQRRYRAQCDENIALLERKIAAVQAGAVTFSTYGNTMTFTDPALQAQEVHMLECINCGFSGHRSR